ncbi:molybdopterin-dependent oxidoreductase [Reyranella sp. CPCC 100927]|uniref:molybdopterin-containing oxidoreductase family protein n=1 Tax=Reyranella sp. CPCC 100927 TaxID=2599616 RepID=UPI0011B4EC1D|nr:molybdopterin oxidoreductase family protein [Reyranella sp. CPCC 100927]TWS98516.1 molybdopterin oxidoreductase family protein [Reyranella sp. CPCC 100927]
MAPDGGAARAKSNTEIVASVCPHDCTSTCALDVERLDDRTIGRVRGSKRNTYTAGVICEKVARYSERVHHPDRLQYPMKRVGPKGSGQFKRIGWDEALDIVAHEFTERAAKFGTETVWPYFYAGTMGLVQRDGIQRLRHTMKYSRWFSTICVTLSDTGWIAGVGAKRGADFREVDEHSDLVVIWGGNPVNTQVNVMHHAMAARKRGATLVVVDPYRTGTAEKADMHLAVRPGTDGALACAVMHVLFAEGFADWDYLRQYTDRPDDLAAHVKTKTPAWASAITGLSVEEIVAFARLYGGSRKAFIRCHHGFSRSRNGAANMHAVTCLPAVTGAWKYQGGGALYGHTGMYPLNRTLIEGLDCVDPSIRDLDQSRLGPILTNDPGALNGGPPVTAMLIQNTNPAMVCPELNLVHKGLAREDLFLCVHEQLPTETVAFADIVLPATTFLEHEDFYTASGHTYFQVTKKVIEPYAESRQNHDVICGLAKRLGAEHRGFDMTVWEIMDETLRLSGMWDAETNHAKGGQDMALPFETAHFLDGFENPDRKFHFSPDWSRFGGRWREMPELPDHLDVIDNATADKPFRMVAAPARTFLNSTFTETPGSLAREKRPTVLMNPDDCTAMGVAEGDRVVLGNERGSVLVHVMPQAGQQRGVVVVEGIWPNKHFERKIGINAITSADPGWPNGGAVFHDTAVWIRPA